MGMLLFDYLVHEGHWDTANRVAEDILLGRVRVSQEVGTAVSKLIHTKIYSRATSASDFAMQLLLTYPVCICGVVVTQKKFLLHFMMFDMFMTCAVHLYTGSSS